MLKYKCIFRYIFDLCECMNLYVNYYREINSNLLKIKRLLFIGF